MYRIQLIHRWSHVVEEIPWDDDLQIHLHYWFKQLVNDVQYALLES